MVKRRKRRQAGQTQAQAPVTAAPAQMLSIPYADDKTSKRFDICVCLILLALGSYVAIALWAACPVPNPDFPGYVTTGKTLLSFDLPANFNLLIAAFLCLMLMSMQFSTVRTIGNGTRMEFKFLLNEYLKNSQPGQKLASRYAGTLRYMAPSRRDDFTSSLRYLSSTTFDEFIEKCYDNDVTYISWSNRGSKGSKGGLLDIAPILSRQESCPPLIFVRRIQVYTVGINVFVLPPKPERIKNK